MQIDAFQADDSHRGGHPVPDLADLHAAYQPFQEVVSQVDICLLDIHRGGADHHEGIPGGIVIFEGPMIPDIGIGYEYKAFPAISGFDNGIQGHGFGLEGKMGFQHSVRMFVIINIDMQGVHGGFCLQCVDVASGQGRWNTHLEADPGRIRTIGLRLAAGGQQGTEQEDGEEQVFHSSEGS